MTQVSSIKLDNYDPQRVYEAVRTHFERIGAEALFTGETRVAIKPNLLAARDPESVVTTHPALVKAVARYCREKGVKAVTVAESPSGLYNRSALEKVYGTCGLSDMDCLNTDLTLTQKGGFRILTPLAEADVVINLPKLKTHGLTRMTCGVKNLFGSIPGLSKPETHAQYPDVESFSVFLLSLAQTVAPAITLLDAVDCMEGNGPGGGTRRFMGYTLCSQNVYALDHAASLLMGYDPMSVLTNRGACERGLYDPGDIVVTGDALSPARPPFRTPDSMAGRGIKTLQFLSDMVRVYPKVSPKSCIGCGKCAESCPMHLITITDHVARMKREGCISCLCCQEMCPQKAIGVRYALR